MLLFVIKETAFYYCIVYWILNIKLCKNTEGKREGWKGGDGKEVSEKDAGETVERYVFWALYWSVESGYAVTLIRCIYGRVCLFWWF